MRLNPALARFNLNHNPSKNYVSNECCMMKINNHYVYVMKTDHNVLIIL